MSETISTAAAFLRSISSDARDRLYAMEVDGATARLTCLARSRYVTAAVERIRGLGFDLSPDDSLTAAQVAVDAVIAEARSERP